MIEEGSTPPPDEFARPGNGRGGRETGGGDGNSITAGEFVPVNTDYIWSAGPGAYIDAMVARINVATGTLYVQHDANFNVTALIETDGDVVERFISDAYGLTTYLNPDWSTDGSGTDYAWVYLNQGLRHEGASNTDDARNRPLRPDLGRPPTPDPLGYPDGMNRYEWEVSNPVNRLDPSGQSCIGALLSVSSNAFPGRSDNFLHCYFSCLIAIECGAGLSGSLGSIREAVQGIVAGFTFNDGPAMQRDTAHDLLANSRGITASKSCPRITPPTKYCSDACGSKYP
jgi:RHS repeat-associated protein